MCRNGRAGPRVLVKSHPVSMPELSLVPRGWCLADGVTLRMVSRCRYVQTAERQERFRRGTRCHSIGTEYRRQTMDRHLETAQRDQCKETRGKHDGAQAARRLGLRTVRRKGGTSKLQWTRSLKGACRPDYFSPPVPVLGMTGASRTTMPSSRPFRSLGYHNRTEHGDRRDPSRRACSRVPEGGRSGKATGRTGLHNRYPPRSGDRQRGGVTNSCFENRRQSTGTHRHVVVVGMKPGRETVIWLFGYWLGRGW